MVRLIVTVVGFIRALAVHQTHPGSVNVNTVEQGPGYGPGYDGYRGRWGYGRRRVIEEEEGSPSGPGY
jgi:hypothetical protein